MPTQPPVIDPATQSRAKIRILVADDESLLSQRLTEFLCSKGFDAVKVSDGNEVRKLTTSWRPHFILYDLMLPELNAVAFLKERSLNNGTVKVLVISGHNDPTNIRECMRMGAADYLPRPISHDAILARIVLHLQQKREIKEYRPGTEPDVESAQFYMHLTDLIMREALKPQPVLDTLHNLTGLTSLSLKAVRSSVIRCDREARKGFVIASSDKRNIGALEIDLQKYPEINYVLNTEKTLAVDNLSGDPTLHFVTKISKTVQFNAMLVAPIRLNGVIWGVVSARLPDNKAQSSDFEIRWTQILAHVSALVIMRDSELARALGTPLPNAA